MSQTRGHRGAGDDGSVLVIALVFLTVGGLIIAGLLSQTETNLKTTTVVKVRAERVYAADAAIENGIQNLRLNQNACSASGGLATIPVPAVNAKTGAGLWVTKLDAHPDAVITSAPVVANGVVYAGVSSSGSRQTMQSS